MKYNLKIYHETDAMKKVSGYMADIMDDWRNGKKKLLACTTMEIMTDRPLTSEEIEKMEANPPEGAERIEIEEA